MNHIFNSAQIKQACVTVICGSDQGTAFYISNTMLLTAYHIVSDFNDSGSEILIDLGGNKVKCVIKDSDANNDICLLTCEEKSTINLPLQPQSIQINENCRIVGYPFKSKQQYLDLSGKIAQIIRDDRSDFLVSDLNIDGNFDYEGFSGSPIIIKGLVVGVALTQLDQRISAISIKKLNPFLEKNNLQLSDEYHYHDVPPQFLTEIQKASPNYKAFENINLALSNFESWFLLSGSPGSGKSLISATYDPSNKSIIPICRYFVKVPNDKVSPEIRKSANFFLQTLENLISMTLTGDPMPAPVSELNYEERLISFSRLLEDLNTFLKDRKEYGLIIIDGLDEISDLKKFLGVFPSHLPSNIKVLLSCTSKEILPVEYQNLINAHQIIQVTPIDISQCEQLIIEEIGLELMSIDAIQSIALKSQGHPLYLRYLINYIKERNLSEGNIEEWVSSIPTIDGDINKYYNSIWASINDKPERLWIIIILSRLRQVLDEETLYKILPTNVKLTFTSYFPSVRFLLNINDGIEIYHNSFKDYVISRTSLDTRTANDLIATYCEENGEDIFSITNVLFHYANSTNPIRAVVNCNQDWADLCALVDVAPDLVIQDIKMSIDLAIDLKEFTSVIRLLLLLQRIEFRYDSVFAENANLIAYALIALGKFDAAIKYIVRDNTLLVSQDEAITFLQIFYENDARHEAHILLNAIDSRFRNVVHSNLTSETIDLSIFIPKGVSLTLTTNDDFQEGGKKIMRFMRTLSNIQQHAATNNDDQMVQAIVPIREYLSCWNNAYLMRRFNAFLSAEEMSKVSGVTLDDKWAKMQAYVALLLEEMMDYNRPLIPKAPQFSALITDIEYLIKQYGYTESSFDLKLFIQALLPNGGNSEILNELIKKYLLVDENFRLRETNGVDLYYKGLHDLHLQYVCRGYSGSIKECPKILRNSAKKESWENFIVSIIRSLGYIEGHLYRLKAEKSDSAIEEIKQNHYEEIVAAVKFTLDRRSQWDRSYNLPESALPIIYSKIVNIFFKFFPDYLDQFTSLLLITSKDQFGLYSEGFTASLHEILKQYIKNEVPNNYITPLLAIWEEHCLKGHQNRWVRTPELLKIIEAYALIGEVDKAHDVFKEMLKTSMGPTWYKEDQLDLLNQLFRLPTKNFSIKNHVRGIAGLLDFASGEMTFQRYVRYEKENLITNFISLNLKSAIEYFKFEILPPPEVLIFNAENFNIDAPRIGDGYVLGARNITEQNGILNILTADIKSPFLKWALCHIFIVSDDTERYISSFCDHIADAVNLLDSMRNPFLDEICVSLSLLATNKNFEEDDRNSFLNHLKRNLSENSLKKVHDALLKKGYEWNILKQEDHRETEQVFKESNSFDLFNIKIGEGAANTQDLIIEGLNAFKKERISPWFANWSTSSDNARKNLKRLLRSPHEDLVYFREHISEYSFAPWIITSQILQYFSDSLADTEKDEIYNLVIEHIALLVRPDISFFNKYDWIETISSISDNDIEIARLIIWLLNHPVEYINRKAAEALLNLCKYEPDIIIPLLLDSALIEHPERANEECSLILAEISHRNPRVIINVLEKKPEIIAQMKMPSHFSIKINLLGIAENLNDLGYSLMYDKVRGFIPQNVILLGNIKTDEDIFKPISYELRQLDRLGLLTMDFKKSLEEKISTYCGNNSTEDLRKSDRYLIRSFYEEKNSNGRFDYLLKYALNVTISNRVDRTNLEKVFKILNPS